MISNKRSSADRRKISEIDFRNRKIYFLTFCRPIKIIVCSFCFHTETKENTDKRISFDEVREATFRRIQ